MCARTQNMGEVVHLTAEKKGTVETVAAGSRDDDLTE